MADDDEMKVGLAQLGDPEFETIIGMVEHLRASTVDLILGAPDPIHAHAQLMTACAMYAGTLFGTLLVAGNAKEQDKRRAAETVTRNFRTGIDVGRRRGMRVAASDVAGHA